MASKLATLAAEAPFNADAWRHPIEAPNRGIASPLRSAVIVGRGREIYRKPCVQKGITNGGPPTSGGPLLVAATDVTADKA